MSIRQRKHKHAIHCRYSVANTLQRCQTKILLPLIVCHEVLKNHRKTEKGNELFLIHQYLFLDDQSLPPQEYVPCYIFPSKNKNENGRGLKDFLNDYT